jgi:hypothetical protein
MEALSMRVVRAAALALVLAPTAIQAQQAPPPPAAPAKVPPAEPASKPLAASSARTFTTPAGVIVNAVRPERVADFEKVLGYLQAALSASANETVRAQAEGWRFYKASEPGPNGSVVYVFLLDPAVTGVEYGLGRILAEAYPDETKLQEIWKLYTDSLASGGSLLSLTPLQPAPPVEPQP